MLFHTSDQCAFSYDDLRAGDEIYHRVCIFSKDFCTSEGCLVKPF